MQIKKCEGSSGSGRSRACPTGQGSARRNLSGRDAGSLPSGRKYTAVPAGIVPRSAKTNEMGQDMEHPSVY